MTSFFWMEIHRFIQPTALLNQKSLMLQHVLSNHFRRRKTQLTPIKPDAHSARPQREAHKKPRAAWLHFGLPSPEGQTREAAAERPAGARVQCPALRGRRWAARPGEARHGTARTPVCQSGTAERVGNTGNPATPGLRWGGSAGRQPRSAQPGHGRG